MKKTILILILCILSELVSSQTIKLIRICRNGTDNTIVWNTINHGCVIMNTIRLLGAESSGSSFIMIDSTIIYSKKQYNHLSANIPLKKDWQYFIQFKLICGAKDTLIVNTDTLSVDTGKPEATFLDSVSVDPISNVVYLGWTSNKSIDFESYYLYNSDKSDPRLAENFKDTFFIDANPSINPKFKSLTYDIASADSCDNRQVYGSNPHKTINLQSIIDTCLNTVSLSWNLYTGWTKIQIQYIYKNINGGGYYLYDSVSSNSQSYLDKNLTNNLIIEYFIRAKKLDQIRNITSSSNSTKVISGKCVQPFNTEILYITNNSLNNIEIKINPNPISSYSSIDLYKLNNQKNPVKIYTFSTGVALHEDLTSSNLQINNYFIIGKNICGLNTDTSLLSNNIVLNLNEKLGLNQLNWNKYFTWNKSVKEYITYSATGFNLSEVANYVAIKNTGQDTFTSDESLKDKIVCYYIEAIENEKLTTSKSNIMCNIKSGYIYYPNAIVPEGINKEFTFKGIGIDLEKSSVQIYNQWGNEVYTKNNISEGWFGNSNDGVQLESGVYFFIAKIQQAEKIITVNGNITIIR